MSAPSFGGPATRAQLQKIADRARGYAGSIGTKYLLRLKLPAAEAKHLLWFDAGTKVDGKQRQPARPILALDARTTEAAREAIVTRLRQDLAAKATTLPMLAALQLGAQAIREVWLSRLTTNGGDVSIAPLSARYAHRKARRGLDPRTGVATGATARALKGALVVVFKVR